MSALMKKPMEELEVNYYQVVELYDLAEALIETVESDQITDPASQLELVEDLALEVGEGADILTDEYMNIVEEKYKHPSTAKQKIEAALRRVYIAMGKYGKQVAKTGKKAGNIADAIVEKIKLQLEQVIAVFFEFVQLSLDKIMHKSQIEELKRRQEAIAVMLHQQQVQG